jgi:hypothetical protein
MVLILLCLLTFMPAPANAVPAPKGFDGFSVERLRPDPPAASLPKAGKGKPITFLGVSDDLVTKIMRKRLGQRVPALYDPKNIYITDYMAGRLGTGAINGLINTLNRFATAAGYDRKTRAVANIYMKGKPSYEAACIQGNKYAKDASWLVKWPVVYALEQGKRKKELKKDLWVVLKLKFRGDKITGDEFTHFSDRPAEVCVLPGRK